MIKKLRVHEEMGIPVIWKLDVRRPWICKGKLNCHLHLDAHWLLVVDEKEIDNDTCSPARRRIGT